MLARVVASALHRFGVVRQLRTLWRKDVEAAQARVVAEVREVTADGRSLHQKLRALDDEQRANSARLEDSHGSIQQLTEQVAALTDACQRLERRAHGLEQVIIGNRRDAARLEGFRRAVESGTLARHVAGAIADAPLTEDPAPMVTVDRLFPGDVYDTFVAAIPPADAFAEKDRTKADYRARRPRAPVPDLTEAVWSHLDADLIPRTMVPAIAERFAPFVSAHYRDLFGDEVGAEVAALPIEATDARLMLRRPGYHLDPHLDPKRVLLTALVYFARPGDSEAHGTAFYRVDGRIVRDHATTYYPRAAGHRCELAHVVPFRPNTAVVFMNAAAHGADLPATAPKGLERYALQFYIGPPVKALADVVRRLPETERRVWAELLE